MTTEEEREAVFCDGENTPDTGPIEIQLRAVATAQAAGRRRDAGFTKPQCEVIQARASRCAVAISASDIIAATSRRIEMASARPFSAARLNHL